MASRLNNPSGPPPSYSVVRKYYNHSLRPILLTLTAVSAAAGAIWCAASFRSRDNDGRINSKLATFDLIFGIIFAVLTAFEIFGFVAVWLQRIPLVRTYALLSVASLFAVCAIEVMSIIMDFMFKSEYIKECVKEVTSPNTVECFGFWCRNDPLSTDEANSYCPREWTRSTVGDFAWFFVALFCGAIFSYLAFAYLRELRSIGRPLNPQQFAMQDYPERYDGLDYQYAPPPGPPPPLAKQSRDDRSTFTNSSDDTSKVPDYEPPSDGFTYEPDAKSNH
ncbi:uncharacterized protein EI90DRAFT_3045501 [Cantharellus anzutake]|uniref:uncharacterized protein n=1 Tax=Cantharellus anzutake TaxID=1750568 RepID=UPI0019083590|nr:uncharacterized protein EI90DRAFT_3045501 [Cantharellus anzutake]KAF8336359.1 hypothetical protein EI90DRAFT_3045501 [Cantharellus anzutake]